MNLLKFFLPFFRLGFGFWGAVIPALINAGGSIASGINQANAEQENYKRRRKAYDDVIKQARQYQQEGEDAFYNNANNPNSYLGVMQRQINDNTNKSLNMGRNQLNTALAQQGIRGGQAGIQLARGLGNMTNQANQDINNMMYNDEQQRKNLQMAYEQAKALAGVNANLQQFQG